MNELNGLLMLAAIILFVAGFTIMMIGAAETNGKVVLSGIFCIIVLSAVILLHPFWGAWHLFLKNAVTTVPSWAWAVVGLTIYFTLNHIYTAWVSYADLYPKSLATKILGPWPIGLLSPYTQSDKEILLVFGTVAFCVIWFVAFVSYALWLIFGGGIAKLLHLLPREPRP